MQSTINLALLRHPKGPLSPSVLGNLLHSGISTLSITTMPVWEARNDNLPSIFGVSRPVLASFLSIRNPRIFPSSHFAQIMKTSARGEFVILQTKHSAEPNFPLYFWLHFLCNMLLKNQMYTVGNMEMVCLKTLLHMLGISEVKSNCVNSLLDFSKRFKRVLIEFSALRQSKTCNNSSKR